MKAAQVNSAIRGFGDHAQDVVASDHHTFKNNFDIFMHFCENDPVMSILTAQLKANENINIEKWYADFQRTGGSFIGSKSYTLPRDREDRIALIYEFMLAVWDERIPWVGFMVDAFGLTNFNDMVWKFNEEFLEKFVRDMGYKLDELVEELPDPGDEIDERALFVFQNYDKRVIIQNVTGSTIAAAGGNVTQSVGFSTSASATVSKELSEVLKEVVEHVKANTELSVGLARRLADLQEEVGLYIAEADSGRKEILNMIEDLWHSHVEESLKPKFLRVAESQFPPILRSLLIKAVGSV